MIQKNLHAVHAPLAKYDDPDVLGHTLMSRVLPLVSSPARYLGGELGATREGFDPAGTNILLGFPDAYEVGMSHQGLRILYHLLMDRPRTYCDIFCAPWPDAEQVLRAEGMPAFGLESRRPAGQFDVVGFSLGYELAYTNMLTMIDLAGSPQLAADRGEDDPIFIAGGSCTLNPTVVGPLLDVVFLGDGEDAVLDVAREIQAGKDAGESRAQLLARLRALPGAWWPGVQGQVSLRSVDDLARYPLPKALVPVMEPVHDRLALEVMRGCVRGCRFCQAGMITRPVRERNPADLVQAAREGVAASGVAEVSLLSLSTSDFSGLGQTVAGIQDALEGQHTNLALPSLRVNSVDEDLYERINRERPKNFTFAPEAGSQRLRDVINKNITEDDILNTARDAFKSGVKGVKLYFMCGLPTETNEDLDELVALVGKVVAIAPRGGSQVHVSVSPFSPKAHTPFQWAGQISREEITRRNNYLGKRLRRLKVKVGLRDGEVSFLECLLGLGDADLLPVVREAWRRGARFDGWTECFDFRFWEEALEACGVDPEPYLAPRDVEAPLPWDSVFGGVNRDFLAKDWKRAQHVKTLPDCRLEGSCYKCDGCDGDQHIFAQLTEMAEVAAQEAEPCGDLFDPRNEDPEKPGKEIRKWSVWRQQAAAKCWYRLEYRKTGDTVFLGHLDFQRQLQLALRRSGLPVAYSKGYHPHPLLKFGPPLPVGVAGLCENLDLALECQVPGLKDILNRQLPAGMRVIRARVSGAQTPPSIDKIVECFDYRAEVPGPAEGGLPPDVVAAACDAFLSCSTRVVTRHRPKGDIEVDVRAMVPTGGLVLDAEPTEEGAAVLRFTLRRSATGATIPVHDFLAALLGPELQGSLGDVRYCRVIRTGYFGRTNMGRRITPIQEVGETSHRFWLGRHFLG